MSFDVNSVRQLFPALSREVNGRSLHYLDNAATAQLPANVLEKIVRHEIEARANVQRGSHSLAERATEAYEAARGIVAAFLNARNAAEVVFTSGTTAAINLLAHALGSRLQEGDEIVVSQAEHHSNLIPWQMLCERSGVKLRFIPVDSRGCINVDNLEDIVTERCRLISITHCSNVTGAVTDIPAVVAAARAVGAQVIVDGAQAVPHGPVDVQALDADYYLFSGHKCFAPSGIGVLWGKRARLESLPPFMGGGGMVSLVELDSATYAEGNRRFEAGTPPIAQAVGLGEALRWMMSLPWEQVTQHEQRLLV